MEGSDPVDVFDLIRMIATARIAVPKAKVRLSAGRTHLSDEAQALCFFAGANSVFYGDKLLTAGNPATQQDLALMRKLDLAPQAPDPALMPPSACANRQLEPVVV
jgi:biotin synthase